jgi:hypothetical protein
MTPEWQASAKSEVIETSTSRIGDRTLCALCVSVVMNLPISIFHLPFSIDEMAMENGKRQMARRPWTLGTPAFLWAVKCKKRQTSP